jgi:hypothetical protein
MKTTKISTTYFVKQISAVVSPGNIVKWSRTKGNLISLEGEFCSDELRQIAKVMDSMFKGTALDPRIEKCKSLNIGGFATKDCRVYYSHVYDENEYNYRFVVVKDNKEYDFYYGKSDGGVGAWWPTDEDDEYGCMSFNGLIPPGFCEASENCYEYHGSHEEAVSLLEACGFTVFKGEDYC